MDCQPFANLKPRAKLTVAKVLEIFRCKESVSSATIVSKKYDVSEKAVRDIWTGRTWYRETSHLDGSRLLQPRKTGQAMRRKDKMPRKQTLVNQMLHFLPLDLGLQSPPTITCPLFQESFVVTEKAEHRGSFAARREAAAFAGCRSSPGSGQSIDELLYVMELQNETICDFRDPFSCDWIMHIETFHLLTNTSSAFPIKPFCRQLQTAKDRP